MPAAPLVVCRRVIDRGAQVVARGAATMPQQEKINSADAHRSRVSFTLNAALNHPDVCHRDCCQQ
jgi:hypothetical protein